MPGCQRTALLLLLLAACDGSRALSDAAVGDATVLDARFCQPPVGGAIEDVTGTPAGPYFVHHPTIPVSQTVLFMPGGPGTRALAQATYELWLAGSTTPDDVLVLVPYSSTNLPAESARAIDVLDEAIACYGADPARVHLAGTSLGGLSAFSLMLGHADRFQTLLGAPGAFQEGDPDGWAAALAGKSIFLGYGELDDPTWISAAQDTHLELAARGVAAELVEFAGEGHILSTSFDVTVFYEFWRQ